MRKINKLFACALVSALAVVTFGACGGKTTKETYVPDENTYRWANTPAAQPEMDEGVKIDGEFNDPVYENIRWLNAVDNTDNTKSSKIRVGTAITSKGLYIAVDVEETGTNIYVNPARGGWCNSCIELYMDVVGEYAMTPKTFEFDLVADGTYSIRTRIPGRSDWRFAYAPHDIAPVTAAKPKGGKINSDTCYGYSCEAFLSKAYLEKIGYNFSEDMEIVLNPVHIISLDYNLTNDLSRVYSQWIKDYFDNYNWGVPNSWFTFGKNGLQAYDVETVITGDKSLGTVTSASGSNGIFKGHNGEIKILRLNGSKLTKFTVNGENALNEVRWSGDVGYFTVTNPTANVQVEAEFSK